MQTEKDILEKNIDRLEKIVCYYQTRRFAVILTPEEEKIQADAERELKIEDDKLYNLIYRKN